jgi:predicted nucleic acid-binding protein
MRRLHAISDRSGLVLDSSVAISWCLPDEQAPEANDVQQKVAELGALAAAHWPLEVANALTKAVRRRRIDRHFRDAALRDLAALPIFLDDATADYAWSDTLRLADTHHLNLYDAAYLELASRHGLPLATFDAELRAAAEALGIAVLGT